MPKSIEVTAEYDESYTIGEATSHRWKQAAVAARGRKDRDGAAAISRGNGGSNAFTDTFEDLHGLAQLPGIAVQRLMADGYGFGAEGDWKTAALVRAMKVMSHGLKGGIFLHGGLHLSPEKRRPGAGRAYARSMSIHRSGQTVSRNPSAFHRRESRSGSIGIHGRERTRRECFVGRYGEPVPADRESSEADPAGASSPQTACGQSSLDPEPDLKIAATAWIYAGGAHHTALSRALTSEHLQNFGEMANMEYLLIDRETRIADFVKELRWNDMYYSWMNR